MGGLPDVIDHEIMHWRSGAVYEIDPATLGQCTGFKDRKGKLVFEGDVVEYTRHGRKITAPITYSDDHACFFADVDGDVDKDCLYEIGYPKIIGNIHDTPELLQEGAP